MFSTLLDLATDFFQQYDAFQQTSGGYDQYIKTVEENIKEYKELKKKVQADLPYGRMADESYLALKYEGLIGIGEEDSVPADKFYNPGAQFGDYFSQLKYLEGEADELIELEMKTLAELKSYKLSKIPIPQDLSTMLDNNDALQRFETAIEGTATAIQAYLREDTSDLDEARLWMAKFKDALNQHIPPHRKKGESGDEVMRQTMQAFRNWASIAQVLIDLFGSQNIINAVYEEMVDNGGDATEYMGKILDLNYRKYGLGVPKELNPNARISVPNAKQSFFGGGFFF